MQEDVSDGMNACPPPNVKVNGQLRRRRQQVEAVCTTLTSHLGGTTTSLTHPLSLKTNVLVAHLAVPTLFVELFG